MFRHRDNRFVRTEPDMIHKLTKEAVELLKAIISIPSPSFKEDAVCSYIDKWMTDKGLQHRRTGNNIIAEAVCDPSRPTLMLCAHIDTVCAGDDYGFDPYRPDYQEAAEVIGKAVGRSVRADEIVAGLGSNDDGASVAAMIAAFRWFAGRSFDPHGMTENPNLILVLTCEEERSGADGMTGLWPEIASKVDFAIIGEPTGMRAATSERGLLVIDAVAEGRSGHAARNEGENALYIALDDIARLRGHEFARVSERMGKVNLNVTQINAGTAHNVIPDRCSFVIDIRPTEKYSNEEILAELRSICRSRLTPRNLANRSSATAEGSPLSEAVETLGIETFSSPTTSDWMRIGCDAVKIGPGESSRSHRSNEFVYVSEIENGINTYIRLCQHFGIKAHRPQR